jgi:hypothetical protein
VGSDAEPAAFYLKALKRLNCGTQRPLFGRDEQASRPKDWRAGTARIRCRRPKKGQTQMADGVGPELRLLVEDSRQEMHIQIVNNGQLKAGMVMTADQLESTIAALCQIRANMQPEVPINYADTACVQAIKGTHFNFEVDPKSKELVFALRDPSRGWLSLRFGAGLLERMLKIARAATGSATKQ